ncbi:MAG: YqeG family HAD IIIA-type phosphatase [Lachnospiraceae bacterium]|nr:YqeG family HAD IIIA-type phosphatase [Lachnospiraceae bacterium]
MFKMLYPNEECSSSYKIKYHELAAAGYKGLIFDIDNTLVPHGAPATEESIALFGYIHSLGLRTCLVSNNKEPRVAPFGEAMNSDYVTLAHKPMPSGYRRACRVMNTDPAETIVVGDQLFTDILGANIAGMKSILVHPIDKKEEIQIVLKRYLEAPILFLYRLSGRKRVAPII